uniref:Putative secreted protein n=1 Tax=Anopheles darlingi TaxID=43151 RepID=A0A2M4DEX4_ANODA
MFLSLYSLMVPVARCNRCAVCNQHYTRSDSPNTGTPTGRPQAMAWHGGGIMCVIYCSLDDLCLLFAVKGKHTHTHTHTDTRTPLPVWQKRRGKRSG